MSTTLFVCAGACREREAPNHGFNAMHEWLSMSVGARVSSPYLIYEIHHPHALTAAEVRALFQSSVTGRVRMHLRSDSLHVSRVGCCYHVHFDDMLPYSEWSAFKRRRQGLRRQALALALARRGMPPDLIREILAACPGVSSAI